MSMALWGHGGLRFFGPDDLLRRRYAKDFLVAAVGKTLKTINQAWEMIEVEGPILMPREFIHPNYDGDDVWLLQAKLGEGDAVLRPETTPSTYRYAETSFSMGLRPPACFYQMGKSFRREQSDGATAAKLRYYEFTQLEFQCIYSADTKADYRTPLVEAVAKEISRVTGWPDVRVLDSDRLPSYSTMTEDVEIMWSPSGSHSSKLDYRFSEMCSISNRTDFPPISNGREMKVLEVAIGMDRVTEIMRHNT